MKNIGFSKSFKNLFVSIRFHDWENKHPCAVLDATYGSVDDLLAFYEYQLVCKQLTCSFRGFQTQLSASEATTLHHRSSSSHIEDRTHRTCIFTLDSAFTQEFDDAFETQPDTISIYISNVCLWMDALQLWPVFPGRAASIFLPDKKRPMLPAAFTERFCSLKAKEIRLAMFMDIDRAQRVRFGNAWISVDKNLEFCDPGVMENSSFRSLLDACRAWFPGGATLETPAQVVAFLMEFINRHVANEILAPRRVGILYDRTRSLFYLQGDEEPSVGGYYCKITSPIRRLPDLLNQFLVQQVLGLAAPPDFSKDHAHAFYALYAGSDAAIEKVNRQMFSIWKIQSECALLHLCNSRPDMLTREFKGEIKLPPTKSTPFQHCCSAYLPELKLWTFVYLLSEDLAKIATPAETTFRLFLFADETKFKKKIRVQPMF